MERESKKKNHQKSYFDVLGICCPSEVPLIERILKSMEGVVTVSVIVPSKTVIVVHDSILVSQLQIAKALNQARLEATVRVYGAGGGDGGGRGFKVWPSPYTMVCGGLLLLSLLHPLYQPLKWLAVAAAASGMPPIILKSIAAARRLTLDINILMLIAVAGSIALRDFWEAGTIVFLFSIAEWLESRSTYKATEVMTTLLSMAPQKAILAGSGEVVDARHVEVNTILAVKAGEVIPIDGLVVDGKCEVDESSLTGESFPVAKSPHSPVWAGTLNINGYITMKTTALAEDSAVAKMTNLVEEAQNNKSRINRLIDSCAKFYTPAVVLSAAAVAVIPVAMRVENQKKWFHLALVLLVNACPCALVLSTPVATFCALSRASTAGILIKGGDYLEALAKTKFVAFDKTGTITRGDFTVVDFRSVKDGVCKDTLLYWISSIESKSSHPMATALVDYARSKSIQLKSDDVGEFQIFPGEGIYGEIDGRRIHIGNRRISTRAGCKTVPDEEEETGGVTAGFVFSGAELIGMFSLSDSCRTGVAEAILELKNMGIKTAMLTGDSKGAASYIQTQLGNVIDNIHADLLPEDKVRIVNELKSREGHTVMVGDGMNDAPALTAANVGISMGISGSAVAMETSHVTLMSNDVRKIPKAIRLAKKTNWKIIENIVLSVTTKGAILALAFAGHPLLWAAVLADVGTCLLVIINSMFLLRTSRMKSHHPEKHHHQHQHSEESRCCKPQHSVPSETCCGKNDQCHAKKPAIPTAQVEKSDCCGNCSEDEIQVEKCSHEHQHSISIDMEEEDETKQKHEHVGHDDGAHDGHGRHTVGAYRIENGGCCRRKTGCCSSMSSNSPILTGIITEK